MKFTKMHGLGNDFILIQCEEFPESVSHFVGPLCNRHKGIGADGLVYVTPSTTADAQMHIFNADGEEAEQCGNAIRCVARYIYDRINIKKETLEIQTRQGVQKVWIQENNQVCVDMGLPLLKASEIPVALDVEKVIQYPLEINDKQFPITCVSMGNPHAVIEVEDVYVIPVDVWGPQIETHSIFPKKMNVEFITIHSPQEITMRVWERGVGQTQACGTGACAATVAGVLWGKLEHSVLVHLEGGDLHIDWDIKTNRLYMTGPATFVFDGELLLDK